MMSLADLLAQIELRGRTWCYSDIGPNNCVSIPPMRALVVHIAIHGSVKLTCAGSGGVTLNPGEAAFILRGDGHALRTGQGRMAVSHAFLRTEHSVDMPETFSFGRSGAGGARALSARLRVAWPATIEPANLPRVLKVTGTGAAAILPALPTVAIGGGSTALLTKAAELILAAELGTSPDFTRRMAPADTDPIERALMMLRADPAAAWSVERLAKAVGMCRSSFAEQFTRQVGRPPMEALTAHRMEFAAVLVREGKLTIQEISESAGYASEVAFSRRFSRRYGLSPKQMRDRIAAQAGVAAPIGLPSAGRLFRLVPAAASSYCRETQAAESTIADRPTLLFRAAGRLSRADMSRP